MVQLVCALGLLGVAAEGGRAASAWPSTPSVAKHFEDEPSDALIRRLQIRPMPADDVEVVTTDPQTGLAVRQRHRPDPKRGLLFIDSTLTNPTAAPRRVTGVRIAAWAFRVQDPHDGGRYRPLTYRNAQWYGSTFWTGPDWTRVGKDWHHSGQNTPSVRRFAVPRDGRLVVAGRVYKADTNNGGGDGVRLAIRHNARTVWKAEIDGGDAKGVEPRVTLDVGKGDAIRFVVHKRGHITCDTTRWDPTITYVDGDSKTAPEQYQASKGFSTRRQGEGGWHYEMQVDPKTKAGLPTVHGFRLDAGLDRATTLIGKPVVRTHRDALPLFVISDCRDASGLVVALTDRASDNRPWRLDTALTRQGLLRVELFAGDADGDLIIEPGASMTLPSIGLGVYRGGWLGGMAMLRRWLDGEPADAGLAALRKDVLAALGRGPVPRELDFWAMIQRDWHRQDDLTDTAESHQAAIADQLGRTRRLLADLQADATDGALADHAAQLDGLTASAARKDHDLPALRTLYLQVRRLKRWIALANPLMRFERLLFCKRVPTSYSHLVMQYYGWRARPGGGIFVLERPGLSLAARDILDGKLDDGNVLEPRLSYDARRIVFSYVKCAGKKFNPAKIDNETDDGFYHIYEVNVDGTGLRQLTRGPYDDLMPTYLPDGGIAFCSTRRRGYARCFGGQFSRRWHVYTLHRMDADGGDVQTLSFNDVNEWFPAVSNDGLVLYSRWDYIDRDAVTHQNLWATRPDGTNPVAVWGNASPTPHCTFQIQPIPNSSKVVFTASAHHSITAGSIAIVDVGQGDDGEPALTRLTPEIPFPEAEGRNIKEYYAAPWPLSERYFLVAYSPEPLVWEPGANGVAALGIYLLDAAGNRELIYRDPNIGSTNPCPLVARPSPPVVESALPEDAPETGEMLLVDVYEGLGDVPRGHIEALRIVQIFPKSTHVANTPPIGMAREENARAILGTVPVEPDGSARFILPAQKPILFQALDEDGFAYQMMRSLTYVQPGERVSCVGCHEPRSYTPPLRSRANVLAARRPASRITPGPLEGQPFSYVRVVQPVLDKHCVKCHGGEKPKKGIDLTGKPHKGFTRSYCSLCADRNFTGAGTNAKNAAEALVPRFGARNQIQTTPPGGMYGALGSRLIKMLRKGHNDVKLSDEEFRRLAAWIDQNAIFYGDNRPAQQAKQLRGEMIAMPDLQ